MTDFQLSSRPSRLRTATVIVAALLLLKVFLAILYQYRWYFPPDFGSEFLSGRQDTFHGAYRAAFYAHILSAPLTLIVGLFLLISGHRLRRSDSCRWATIHRYAGRMQAVAVLLVVVPSGLVMARQAFAGAVAGMGLAALAMTTAVCVVLAIHSARIGKLQRHQRWATRSCILLASPLLLRLMSGVVLVTQLEPLASYRFNAWSSWLIPLGSYELLRHYSAYTGSGRLLRSKREAMQ